jgi:periplasmic divalent cation tolerance protein
MKAEYIQVFVSCESKEQAKLMVDSLLNDQIIACAQILPGVESFYHWHGQTVQSSECMLLLKSHKNHFKTIEAKIKKLHSYEVPEIIAVPLVNGSTEYLNWINEQTKPHN